MGVYFVGVRTGEIIDESITSTSHSQLEETANRLKQSPRLSHSLSETIYSGSSLEQLMTALLLAKLLGGGYTIGFRHVFNLMPEEISSERYKKILFFTKKIRVPAISEFSDELESLWNENRIIMGVCRGEMIWAYLERHKWFDKTKVEPLKPGESCIIEYHSNWATEEDQIVTFPSRNLNIPIGYRKSI